MNKASERADWWQGMVVFLTILVVAGTTIAAAANGVPFILAVLIGAGAAVPFLPWIGAFIVLRLMAEGR